MQLMLLVMLELEQYQQDPFTDFTYMNNAYEEVFGLIKKVSTIQNIKKIPEIYQF